VDTPGVFLDIETGTLYGSLSAASTKLTQQQELACTGELFDLILEHGSQSVIEQVASSDCRSLSSARYLPA
jgi:hypothetical protein